MPMRSADAASLAGLPYLGLGLGSNLGRDDLPQPYRLWDAEPGLFDYVEYSAPLDLEAARREAGLFDELWARRARVPVLLHPVHLNLYGPELQSSESLRALDAHARAVGSPWVSNDVAWWRAGGHVFPGHRYVAPPFSEAGIEDCARHARHVQEALSVPLLLENPAVFARRGPLHVLAFMAALHERTGCGLLLDLGHLLSHQLACGLPPDAGLDAFPLGAVVEIHVAGGVVTRTGARDVYVDDHPQPVREEVLALLEALAPRCASLRAVTFEADGQPDPIAAATLRRLRGLVPPPEPGAPAPGGGAPVAGGERERGRSAPGAEIGWRTQPWSLYEQVFAGAGDPEDVEGTRAEIDFRLAVLADELDRDWPWTRRLLAGDRAALLRFSGSRELRARFAGDSDADLAASFASWARARLREVPEEGAARVFAFEDRLRTAVAEAARAPAPAAGRVGLGAGVALVRAAHDLSELLYAGQALQRHLDGRAQAAGVWHASGLEALRQVARRAPPGPWWCAARRRGGRLETLPLPAGLARVLVAARAGGSWERFAAHPELPAVTVRWALAAGWMRRGAARTATGRPVP